MDMSMGNVVYWHKNQVIIRARSKAAQPANQDSQPTNTAMVPFPIQQISVFIADALKGLNVGLQLFDTTPPLSPATSSKTSDVADDFLFFYRIVPTAQPAMGTMQGSDGAATIGTEDKTLSVIKSLTKYKPPNNGAQQLAYSLDFMPHWLWTGTDDQSHGCPLSPPIPLEDSGAAGQWKISFQLLVDPSLQEKTGQGVMVFVLDTLPPQYQIERAARDAWYNTLLQRMTAGLTNGSQPNVLPPAIKLNYSYDAAIPAPSESVTTGKDIYGRLVGFPMADHGMAIAGIIRDLAPDAEIECIRVLNDYGVGDIRTLAKVLTDLHQRMAAGGDLVNKPVVVNLSLVVLPPGNGMPDGVTEDILQSTRDLLYTELQALADKGAVFTASSGNDSDPRDTYMNPLEVHFGSRYPAALAYDEPPVTTMIPVGAANQKGEAAIYSNHPGYLGIATYAGELPRPDPWVPSAMSHTVTRVVGPIDALCCVYTSRLYPALSVNDHHAILPESPSEYPMYEASSSWAYWSGTSFATPIISALAARILQGQGPNSIDVRQAIRKAATQKTMWNRVGDAHEDISGLLIMATQVWQPDNDAMHT
jgi:hypothetical protein